MTKQWIYISVAIVVAVAACLYIVRTNPQDCASVVRSFEQADTSYLKQNAAARDRYERCKKQAAIQ